MLLGTAPVPARPLPCGRARSRAPSPAATSGSRCSARRCSRSGCSPARSPRTRSWRRSLSFAVALGLLVVSVGQPGSGRLVGEGLDHQPPDGPDARGHQALGRGVLPGVHRLLPVRHPPADGELPMEVNDPPHRGEWTGARARRGRPVRRGARAGPRRPCSIRRCRSGFLGDSRRVAFVGRAACCGSSRTASRGGPRPRRLACAGMALGALVVRCAGRRASSSRRCRAAGSVFVGVACRWWSGRRSGTSSGGGTARGAGGPRRGPGRRSRGCVGRRAAVRVGAFARGALVLGAGLLARVRRRSIGSEVGRHGHVAQLPVRVRRRRCSWCSPRCWRSASTRSRERNDHTWDLTKTQTFTLSDQARRVARGDRRST